MKIYLDASSAIKLYKEGEETAAVESIVKSMLDPRESIDSRDTNKCVSLVVQKLFTSFLHRLRFIANACGQVQIFTSQLTIAEIIRGLSKGGLSEKELKEIESDFRNYEGKGLIFVPVSDEIIDSAIHYVRKNKLFVADAIHLVTALEHTDVMVTNDKYLLKESLKSSFKGKIKTFRPSGFEI